MRREYTLACRNLLHRYEETPPPAGTYPVGLTSMVEDEKSQTFGSIFFSRSRVSSFAVLVANLNWKEKKGVCFVLIERPS